MKQVPNLITCLNLLAGSFACVMALKFNNYTGAFIFIVLAAVFDFLDGLAARLLKAYSKLGAELDSLADVISFGLAPGCVVYSYFSSYTGVAGFPLLAFLLPVFSALRLAKFNIDTRQTTSFLGLPVPASGLFWSSLIPSIHWIAVYFSIVSVLTVVVILIIAFCLLMVSELPMFSLKFKNLKWADNRWPFSLIGISVVVMAVFTTWGMALLGISVIVLVYILLSVIKVVIERPAQ
ncbi:MAG: CDP-diacylglycerol--serine O-phosphatidyltransferase [Dysgonamonadaceae bacterium]|jgi:CDP-diacylglycerol--serine O-phosphatidyltransferase|nr:CDP-diacylglycerol--serine O-phosphatidyltransferase [Dysgonamonadaceae bacterium]